MLFVRFVEKRLSAERLSLSAVSAWEGLRFALEVVLVKTLIVNDRCGLAAKLI